MAKKLPRWAISDTFPAFHDVESLSAIEMTARLYGAMNEMVKEYNKFVEDLEIFVNEHEQKTDAQLEDIQTAIAQKFKDFIDIIELKVKNQDREIQNGIRFMKSNIIETTQQMLEEMLNINAEDLALKPVKVHFPFHGYDSGDCTIIETENYVAMIDCGIPRSQGDILEYMRQHAINHIDYFIISHFHEDHVGFIGQTGNYHNGIDQILNDPDIDTSNIVFLLPHGEMNYTKWVGYNSSEWVTGKDMETIFMQYFSDNAVNYEHPIEGQSLWLDDCKLSFHNVSDHYLQHYYDVTHTYTETENGKTRYNNFSMVVQLSHGKNKMLFAGDIESKAQEMIANELANPDVLKIEHHALNYVSAPEYLQKLAPKYSVVCEYALGDRAGDTMRCPTFAKARQTGTLFSMNYNGTVVITSDKNDLFAESENGCFNEMNFRTLDSGKGLAKGEDLDDITTVGEYFSPSGTITNSLLNCAHTASGMKLVVEHLVPDSPNGLRQTIYGANSIDAKIYTRCNSGGVWQPWTDCTPLMAGQLIPSGTDLDTLVDGVVYCTASGTISKSLVNAPNDLTTSIKIINHLVSLNHIKQIIICGMVDGAPQCFYMRHLHRTEGGKTPWYKFVGTAM